MAVGTTTPTPSDLDIIPPVVASGSGGGAPVDAQYVVMALDSTLTQERVLTAGAGITIVDGGANSTVTISTTFPAQQPLYVYFA